MTDPRRARGARFGAFTHQLMALVLLAVAGSALGAAPAPASPSASDAARKSAHPALAHIERGIIEMRSDPEASKRDADEALRLLQQQPDADLEARAHLLLCD